MKKEIQQFIDNELSEENESTLLRAVLTDNSLGDELIEQKQLDSVLSNYYKDHSTFVSGVIKKARRERKSKKKNKVIPLLFACAALIVIGFTVAKLLPQHKSPVANLYTPGSKINLSKTESLDFTLESGVKVKLKGPASVTVGSNDLNMKLGLINATVPKNASGFTVKTPQGIIRDLSTEFSVKVDERNTSLKVIKGQVKAKRNGEAEFATISENETVNINDSLSMPTESQLRYSGKLLSINFTNEKNLLTEATGAFYTDNWNNILPPFKTASLNDNFGKEIPVEILVNNENSFSIKTIRKDSPQAKLYKVRLTDGIFQGQEQKQVKPLEIHLKNIPYKRYEIYVYYWTGKSSDNHIFNLSVNDGKKFFIQRHESDSPIDYHTFVPWSGAGKNESGNFLIFKNLSKSDAVIKAHLPNKDGVNRTWRISGLQVIELK